MAPKSNSSPKTDFRLTPILRAYLDDLSKLGVYGKNRSEVVRRFVENGIKDAIEKGVIAPRNVSEFDESAEAGEGEAEQ